MSIAFVQQNDHYFANSSNAASEQLAYSSNNTAGNMLVCVTSWLNNAQAPASVTDSQGNTWTALTLVQVNANANVQFFYAPNCKGGVG